MPEPPLGQPAFFVVGTGRCGTNLLRRLLDEHPRTFVVRETHWLPLLLDELGDATCSSAPARELLELVDRVFMPRGERAFDRIARLIGIDPGELRRRWLLALGGEAAPVGVAAFMSAYYRVVGEHVGRPIVGDKTPDYGFHLERLHALWPQARFVHIVRDGRDVALSMSKVPTFRYLAATGELHWLALGVDQRYEQHRDALVDELPAERFFELWRRRCEQTFEQAQRIPVELYLEIRYEDLLLRPDTTLDEISEHLNLPDRRRAPWRRWTRPRTPPLRWWRDTDPYASIRPENLRRNHGLAEYRRLTETCSQTLEDLLLGRPRIVGDGADALANPHPAVRLAEGVELARWRLRRVFGRGSQAQPVSSIEHGYLERRLEHRWGEWPLDLSHDEAVAVCVVRDAAEYLPGFLEHHFALGIRHLVFVANPEVDPVLDEWRDDRRVTLLRTRASFSRHAKSLRILPMRLLRGSGWALQLDIDELFDYPFSEHVRLPDLLRYLNRSDCDAVLANMLELFGPGSLDPEIRVEGHPRALCRYYTTVGLVEEELSSSYELHHPGPKAFRGGIRKIAFDSPSTLLYKIPLYRLGGRIPKHLPRVHRLLCSPRLADLSGVLQHYQFTPTLLARAIEAVDQNIYDHGSRKYRSFLAQLQRPGEIDLMRLAPERRLLESTDQLIDDGFLFAGPGYRRFAEELGP